jgi:glycosyltransferase involved in cell wall biosynthesis
MKVLWFTPTPALAEEYLNMNFIGGGWIKSLEKELRDKIDLSLAFYLKEKIAPFSIGNSKYFPIYKNGNGLVSRIVKKVFGLLESEQDISQFLKIIEDVQPDVIHVHGTEFNFGLIQRHTKVPVVVSIQGNITVYQHKYYSGMTYWQVLRYSKLKNWLLFGTKINSFTHLKRQAAREQEILKLSFNLIGRTAWDKRVCKILSPQSRYFHNDEILRDEFYRNEWSASWDNKPTSILRLFTTAGDTLYKGIETVIYCAALLDNSGINYQWEVAGMEKNDEIVLIATKSTGQKLSNNLRFIGKNKVDKLIERMLETHIYVACSHIDNSPNSLCEAQILGIPCIATNAGGTSSLLLDGVEGVLIQDGDPYAMAGAIIELKENYGTALGYGKNARITALKRHNKSIIVGDLINIYNGVKTK